MKHFKLTFLAICVLAGYGLASAATYYDDQDPYSDTQKIYGLTGLGTTDSPILIGYEDVDEDEWNLLADYVNGDGKYQTEHDCTGLEIAICNDISVAGGTTLQPLKYFNGHMYGNYGNAETHDIAGMGPDFDDTDYFPEGNDTKYFGMLFCTIGPDGLVENLTISKEELSDFSMSGTGTVYPVSVGIVGRLQGTLKNVSSDQTRYYYGNQIGFYYGETQVQYLGGLAGWVDGGTIEDCVYDYHTYCKNDEILNNTDDSELKLEYVGGIAGYVSNGGKIINCSYGNADDFADDSSDCSEAWMWGSCYTGGIVGLLDGGTVDNCYSYGTVICKSDNSEYSVGAAGGIVGLLKSGLVNNCTSNNADRGMTSKNDGSGDGWWYNVFYGRIDTWTINGIVTPGYAGGIVGEINASSLLSGTNGDKPTALVSGCTVNSSTLIYVGDYSDWTYPSDDDTTFDRSSYAGGIVGKSTNGTIVNCTNYAPIEGVTYLGGVAGYLYGSNTLTGNVNWGSVTSTNTETITFTDDEGGTTSGVFSYAGGIAGTAYYSSDYSYTFDGCKNYGTITVGSGSERVGGIISELFGDVDSDGNYNCSISNCENHGKISGADMIAGGIVGVASGASISGCTNSSVEIDGDGYTGYVATSGSEEASTGGIVGKAQSNTSISDCTNGSTIYAQGQYVGGVVGALISGSSVSDSSNSGSVTGGIDSSLSTGYVGGVVGSAYGSESNTVSVTGCSNSGSVTTSTNYFGGVAGRLYYATASNCSNTASITAASTSSYTLGGIAGYAQLSSISGSSNSGNLTGESNYTGGITGYADATPISDCYNSGTITGTQLVGGIAGTATGTVNIASCYNYGTITGTSSSYSPVGGICGYINSTGSLSDCYNSGAVSGVNYAGGICGYSYGSNSSNFIQISGCKNEGSVSSTTTSTTYSYVGGIAGTALYTDISRSGNTGAISGAGTYTGGIVGCGQGYYNSTSNYYQMTVTNCINTGAVSGSGSYTGGICGRISYADFDNLYNTGTVNGTSYTGGIVGYCVGTKNLFNSIDGCINYGAVSGSASQAGGIAGNISYTDLATSYNTGDVTATSQYAGGIVGVARNSSTISQTFNVGVISCSGSNAGGIAGAFDGTISYSYNNSPVSATSAVGGLVGSLYTSSKTLSISYAYTSDSISATSTDSPVIGPIIGQEVTSSSTDVTLKNVYYLKYDAYAPSNKVTNYVSDSEGAEISAMQYGELAGYQIDDSYFTIVDSYSYPVLKSICDNDYALAYAAPVVPYVDETIASDRALDSADTYDAITDWCYLGGYADGVTWTSDEPLTITNANNKNFNVSDQSTWETSGYTVISDYDTYWRADFKLTNGVSTVLYANSNSYEGTLISTAESTDIAAAAAVRDDDSDSTPSTITSIITPEVSVPTKLTFSSYSNSGNYTPSDDDDDSNSSTGGYTDSDGNGFTSGIDTAESNAATIVSEQYYSISGARVNEPTNGAKAIYIVVRQLSDGTTQTLKVVK